MEKERGWAGGPIPFPLSFPFLSLPNGKVREERGNPDFPSFFLHYLIISYPFLRKGGKERNGPKRTEMKTDEGERAEKREETNTPFLAWDGKDRGGREMGVSFPSPSVSFISFSFRREG